MGEVRLRSEIPAGHPAKAPVEAAVSALLCSFPGSWSAEVSLARHARWWLVSVSRAGDGFQASVFVDAAEQNAADVSRLLAGSIQHLR